MAKVQHRDDNMLARKMSKNGRNWKKRKGKMFRSENCIID